MNGKMKMKVKSSIAALVLAGALGGTAMAQSNSGYVPWNNPGPGQVARFDNGYLDEHPEVARQLAANPSLVDNAGYMGNHPGLREYLGNHQWVRTELKDHPYRFMTDEHRYNRWEEGHEGHPLGATDHYFDQHPEVGEQLNKRPWLVDDRHYVDNHPGLHEFLASHPIARSEWRSHPYRFMRREDHFERNH
ncbi:MAG TPA: hypothetical protein VJN94_13370 [Candidatus Binataceae bacterium]|nr:hypothetical protein [Candidatus Binataceae bacterium]